MKSRLWRHVILNARCSWLPGDIRGFRSREHRIHSSGDYKNPPPKSEHAGLRRYHQRRSGQPVSFDEIARIAILRAFVLKIRSLEHRIIVGSCAHQHLHGVAELPGSEALTRREVGKCKQRASHDVRAILPGSIWSEGGTYDPVYDVEHFWNAYNYIRYRQECGAVVWSHRDDENWIDHPEVGVIIMRKNKRRIRVFED